MTSIKREITEKLIKLKQSEAYNEKFEDATGNPVKLKKVWAELATELYTKLDGREVKEKYHQILNKYKKT